MKLRYKLLIGFILLAIPLIAFGAPVLQGVGGGTGISTSTAGNDGLCLVESSSSPFLMWQLGTCGTGSGGSSTVVKGTNGVSVTNLSNGIQTSSLNTAYAASWSALETFLNGINASGTVNVSSIY